MDGFHISVQDGRLAISETRSARVVEWIIVGLSAAAIVWVFASFDATEHYVLPLICTIVIAAPIYLLGVGRHPTFTFDIQAQRLLRGRRALCETGAIDVIEVDDIQDGECVCHQVCVVCRDGTRHQIGEYAQHQMAMHLAERIGAHLNVPVRVTLV